MTQPRGIRNNNPGNIEWGDPWQGLRPLGSRTDGRFAQFQTPAYGIRALARTLITYQDKHRIKTVQAAINRWAPPVENDTGSYVKAVAAAVGVGPTHMIDMQDYWTLRKMVEAIIRHENGKGPLSTANSWYGEDVIEKAMVLAGVPRPVDAKAGLPVTRETVGATAAGAAGAAQIVEVLPEVSVAISAADEHLSSGSWIRIAVGLFTITIAVMIAWSQVKKHKSGVV